MATVKNYIIKFDAEQAGELVSHYWTGSGWSTDVERAKVYEHVRARVAFRAMTAAMDREDPRFERMKVTPDPRWLAEQEATMYGVACSMPPADGKPIPNRWWWDGSDWTRDASKARAWTARSGAYKMANRLRRADAGQPVEFRLNTHTLELPKE